MLVSDSTALFEPYDMIGVVSGHAVQFELYDVMRVRPYCIV